jgi:hypothetical protein
VIDPAENNPLRVAALHYAALGLHVLPVWWLEDGRCACGKADCLSPGKHPIKSLVPHGHQDATVDPVRITAWYATYSEANLGISLIASYLCAVDVDPRNGGDATFEALEAEHGMITSGWHQRTGSGGDHFVFAIQDRDIRLPGKLGPGVDLKCNGYILVEPSTTAGAYEWLDGGPLDGDMPTDLLPWIEALASAPQAPAPTIAADAVGFEWMGDEGRAELTEAMEACKNVERDDWFRMGMVLHMLDPNPHGLGYELWEWWSQLGNGAKKFDAKDQARVWLSFSRKKDVSLHRESIFYWANENGWRSEKDRTVDEIAEQVVEAIETRFDHVKVADPAPGSMEPFPVPMLGEVERLIGSSAYVNYPIASRVGAIALACVAASRCYATASGEVPHSYLCASATSAESIRYTLNAVQSILSDSGLENLFQRARKTTPSAIYASLIKAPAHIYLCDDWGNILAQAKRYTSGPTDYALSILASIYSQKVIPLDGFEDIKKALGEPRASIYAPSLSMLAVVSNEQLSTMTRPSEIGRGALVSFLSVICEDDDAIVQDDPVAIETPPWLSAHLHRLRHASNVMCDGNLSGIDKGGLLPPSVVIPVWTCSAKEWDAEILALSDRLQIRPLLHGARVSMRRIAIALAAWANPEQPVVTPDIMAWTGRFVVARLDEFLRRFNLVSTAEDGKQSVYQLALAVIDGEGKRGANFEKVRVGCYQFRQLSKEKRHELIELLVEDGEIQEVTRGRKSFYVASRFIDKESTKFGNSVSSSVTPLPNSSSRQTGDTTKFGNSAASSVPIYKD